MPGPQPGTGYTPTFGMPIIAAPPSGTDPEVFYPPIVTAAALTVRVEPPHRLRIQVAMTHRQLFAVNGGTLRFDPTTAGGTLVLTTWAVDAGHIRRDLPGGMPPPKQVFYEAVDAASVRTALGTATLWNFVPEAWIRQSWQAIQGTPPPSGTTQAQLRTFYLDQVMAGRRTMFVPGGTALGDAAAMSGSTSNSQFVLRFTNAGDNALSPVPYIRTMPLDEYGGPKWVGHPLILATESLPVPLDFYARFEIYDLVDRTFKPVPAGIVVDLMDDDPVDSEVLVSHTTNADGVTHFGFARQEDLHSFDSTEIGRPDLYFRIHSRDIPLPFAHHSTLPEMWSTKGWRGVDGVAGYYADFVGTQIGAHDAPAVFRIGVDYHLRLRYFNSNRDYYIGSGSGRWEHAPAGIPVNIVGPRDGWEAVRGPVRTDENGEVHGVTFEIASEEDISFSIIFAAGDPAINMREMVVIVLELWDTYLNPEAVLYWLTEEDDEDRNNPGPTYIQDNAETSLGADATPLVFTIRNEQRRVALNLLKLYREWATVVYHLTGGDFPGIPSYLLPGLPGVIAEYVITEPFGGISYSYPEGRVNISGNAHWNRAIVMHELSHQLMWLQANYDITLDLFEYSQSHSFPWEINGLTAWVEGWAEFMTGVITGERHSLTHVTPDRGGTWQNLGPTPAGRGEMVEGAFASALLELFDKHVAPITGLSVAESANGDPMTVTRNAWLNDTGIANRFRDIFWQPLRDMRGVSSPTARGMAEAIEARNRPRWHNLVLAFQHYNMCAPILSAIAPGSTRAAGGATIELTGRHFSQGAQVHIDGVSITSAVIDSQRITFMAPAHAVGGVDVKVVTTSLHETASRILRYV